MVYGRIISCGESGYTYLKKLFSAIGDIQKDYKWLISNAKCQTCDEQTQRMLEDGCCIISGRELTDITERADPQWIWGTFSAFEPSVTDAQIFSYRLPRNENYPHFWGTPLTIQHPLARMEIVALDSSLTLILTRDFELPESFHLAYPLSEDLAEVNSRKSTAEKYSHCDSDDSLFYIHDCQVTGMKYGDGRLSFEFEDGLWVLPQHPDSHLDKIVRTDRALLEFLLYTDMADEVCVYVFRRDLLGRTIREEWSAKVLCDMINRGECKLELLYMYSDAVTRILDCSMYLVKRQRFCECELRIETNIPIYQWNRLREDAEW